MLSSKKYSEKPNKTKKRVRILALILALLMVAGGMASIIMFLATSARAETTYDSTKVINTSSLKSDGDVLVSVGLLYGDDAEPEFRIRSSYGFEVGTQVLTEEKEFTKIWDISDGSVACLSDANIAKNNGIYSIANGSYDTYIGGYHVQIDCDDLDRVGFENLMYSAEYMLSGYGLEVIPAYIYTGYAIRIGNFATWDDAAFYYDTVASLFPEKYISVVTPAKTAVSVIDANDRIIFEYDCGQNSVIGFRANADEKGNTYMMTPAGNTYDGTFAFKRYVSGDTDGVSLINILPLEAYVAGVLPYEISNSWPIEVQKEFAITVRSYTLTHLNAKHASYGFDLCNTTCCEVYKGSGRVNDAVMQAVTETRGNVICYDGGIVTSYYSSTCGGVTVSAADCWGGKDVPYLQAVDTPWEDYMNHSNGFWMYEVSPEQLCERLNKAGYNQLKGAIADVRIEELAKNSTYVKKLAVTDIYGTSVTITYTDNVRTSLTPYVKSANFVVGKGSVEYSESHIPNSSGTGTGSFGGSGSGPVEQKDKSAGFIETDEMYVLTSQSFEKIDYRGCVNILTATGEREYTKKNIFVITSETAKAYLGDEYDETAADVGTQSVESQAEPVSHVVETDETAEGVVYKTAYAKDSRNFIFVGKGWGHGVGMSQWGAYDLAVKGYTYDQIIKAYFPTITIVHYRETNNFR